MALDYSVTNLLQSIRDMGNVGASQQDWPDSKLIRLLNRQVQEYLVPFIESARKNHFATYTDQALVANQAAYWMPSKAAGSMLRAAQLVDANGNPYGKIVEDDLEAVINYGASFLVAQVPAGLPQRYFFRGNQVVLYPTPAAGLPSLSLRLYYEARPSTLVANASCVQITGFPGGAAGGNFRISFTGTAPTTYSNGTVCDLVQNKPAFDVLFSGAIQTQGAGYFEFTGTLPTNLLVNDWVCIGDTAPVITGSVPEIVIGCLVDYSVLKAFQGKMDIDSFRKSKELLSKDEAAAKLFLRRRNRGDHDKAGEGALYRFKGAAGGPATSW